MDREAQADLSYVTGLTSHAVLQAWAREVVAQAQRAYGRDGARSPASLDVIPSRDVVAFAPRGHQGCSVRPGVTTRFVVTDMEHARTQVVYRHLSCARGQMENEMKDHQLSLTSDRTSCHPSERTSGGCCCIRPLTCSSIHDAVR